MASLIDSSKPSTGHATTKSVRDNFQMAKQDIEYMQNQIAAMAQRIMELESVIGDLVPGDGSEVDVKNLHVSGTSEFDGQATFHVKHGSTPLTLVDMEEDNSGLPFKTPHPDTLLMLRGRTTGPNTNIELVTYGGANLIRGYASEQNAGVVTATGLSRNMLIMTGSGYDGVSWQNGRGAMWITASETWTPTANGTQISWRTTLNGQTAQQDSMLLSNAGNLVLGSMTDTGQKLQVNGTSSFAGNMTSTGRIDANDVILSKSGLIVNGSQFGLLGLSDAKTRNYQFQFNSGDLRLYETYSNRPIFTYSPSANTFTLGTPSLVSADPTAPLGIATKQYVDSKAGFDGGTVTGDTTFTSNLTISGFSESFTLYQDFTGATFKVNPSPTSYGSTLTFWGGNGAPGNFQGGGVVLRGGAPGSGAVGQAGGGVSLIASSPLAGNSGGDVRITAGNSKDANTGSIYLTIGTHVGTGNVGQLIIKNIPTVEPVGISGAVWRDPATKILMMVP